IASACGEYRDFAARRQALAGRQPEGSRDSILFRFGENSCQVVRLVQTNPCRQAILAGFAQFADNAFDPLRRLAFTVDDFGKTAAIAAMQVQVSETQIRIGMLGESLSCSIERNVA